MPLCRHCPAGGFLWFLTIESSLSENFLLCDYHRKTWINWENIGQYEYCKGFDGKYYRFREENDAIIKSGSDILKRHKNIVDKKSVKAYSVLMHIIHMIQIVRIRYGHAFIESNDKQAIK